LQRRKSSSPPAPFRRSPTAGARRGSGLTAERGKERKEVRKRKKGRQLQRRESSSPPALFRRSPTAGANNRKRERKKERKKETKGEIMEGKSMGGRKAK
jgi:hypothetical protein